MRDSTLTRYSALHHTTDLQDVHQTADLMLHNMHTLKSRSSCTCFQKTKSMPFLLTRMLHARPSCLRSLPLNLLQDPMLAHFNSQIRARQTWSSLPSRYRHPLPFTQPLPHLGNKTSATPYQRLVNLFMFALQIPSSYLGMFARRSYQRTCGPKHKLPASASLAGYMMPKT